MKCYAIVTILVLSIFLGISAHAQTSQPQGFGASETGIARELESYFSNPAPNGNAFSGAVLVAKDGAPIFKRAFGLANRQTNLANNTDTRFNIGSMNKMFTAVAIAQLAERGKLSFDDTVSKHLPDYPNQSVARKITIHQLLTHTSGMGDYLNEKYYAQLDKMKTVADLVPLFANDPLLFEPGSKWQYSNSGYIVLGLLIEKVSGLDYFDYVRESIFKVAGMDSTDSYERGSKVPNLAIGYTRMNRNGPAEPSSELRDNSSTRPAKGSPAGGGYSTTGDLLKFALALQNYKLLTKEYTAIVTTGKVEVGGPMGKYAYGFGDKMFDGKHIVGHNGGAPGIAANLDIFPELGYTVIILSNHDPRSMMPVIMKIRGLLPRSGVSRSQPVRESNQNRL